MKKLLFAFVAMMLSYAGFAQCASVFSLSGLPATATQKLRVQLTNSSTPSVTPGQVNFFVVDWGDANMEAISVGNKQHNYAAPGTYNVSMVMQIWDSVTYAVLCADTTYHSITVAYDSCATVVIDSVHNPLNPDSVTFYLTHLGAGTGMYYYWLFGDGTTYTSTSTTVSHVYSTPGNKTVTVIANDSISGCTDTARVIVYRGNCTGLNAGFTSSHTGTVVSFTNTSSSIPGANASYVWSFGDGTSSSLPNPIHTYAVSDSYWVCLITTWRDSLTSAFLCTDSICNWISAVGPSPAGDIAGYIFQDSTTFGAPRIDSPYYKVWLIQYDSATTSLYAVDSQIVGGGYFYMTPYQFSNPVAGVYRVKAQLLNGPTSGASYVPTYHTSALMWYNATLIYHSGSSLSKHIYMQAGMATSGPGFVAGNVSAGANKGTSAGIPDLTILLLDAAGKPVQATVTDANGNYSFSNLPPAAYTVHPEQFGYNTITANATVVNDKPTITGVDFTRSLSKKTITPAATGIANVSSNHSFAIYPNPARDIVSIEWVAGNAKDATVVITDISGKVVLNQTIKDGTTELNLQSLHKGLYFITLESENIKNTQKLLLQ
ncbi:MAG TPA: PKD domain-containing protein [Flavipsychrobacter sp.]